MIEAPVEGFVKAGFEPVREAFSANFDSRGDVGAACCIHVNGRPVVDLWGGVTTRGGTKPYTADTLQLVASTTKASSPSLRTSWRKRGSSTSMLQ
jgi:CubicO group peptidase (beta-lactamase class C family)